MLDEFFIRALLGGVGLALAVGPLGCFVVWRRMAYFGDTMAHSALLGVVISLLFNFSMMIGVFGVAVLIAVLLIYLQRRQSLPTDSLLGILSHSALAIGLVCVAFMQSVRVDLMAFLFGDILSITWADVGMIYGSAGLILLVLRFIWRPLLAGTVNVQMAEAEGLKPERAKFVFMILMALVVAIAIKLVGILLITSLLIIPAATARRFAKSPEQMAVLAAMMGGLSVAGGLFGSLYYDTPSGPSVVVCALLLFIASLMRGVKARGGQ